MFLPLTKCIVLEAYMFQAVKATYGDVNAAFHDFIWNSTIFQAKLSGFEKVFSFMGEYF